MGFFNYTNVVKSNTIKLLELVSVYFKQRGHPLLIQLRHKYKLRSHLNQQSASHSYVYICNSLNKNYNWGH